MFVYCLFIARDPLLVLLYSLIICLSLLVIFIKLSFILFNGVLLNVKGIFIVLSDLMYLNLEFLDVQVSLVGGDG